MSKVKEFKERRIAVNYIYNIIYLVSNMAFPLITFPYVTRVLQAGGLGIVSFYQTLLHYVILFFSVGIPMYGIREIAQKRHNIDECNKSLIEIFILHLNLSLISYIVIFIICYQSSGIIANDKLFLILSIQIILNTLGCEWFYKGIEDFKFITIRSIIVKIISIAFLYSFVKHWYDVDKYAWFVVISTAGSNIWNFCRLRRYIDFSFIKSTSFNPFLHLIPSGKVFYFNFIFNSYSVIDVALLGIIGTTVQVGFYTGAMKFVLVIAALLSALSNVLLPRLTSLYNEHKYVEFKALSEKSFDYILAICPVFIFIIIAEADDLISLFCGNTFGPSKTTLKILSPLVMTLSIIKLLGMQLLYPQGKENKVATILYISSIIEILLCIALYKSFGHNGVALSVLTANVFAIILMTVICHENLPVRLKLSHIYYIVFAIISVFCCREFVVMLELHAFFNIMIIGSLSVSLYFLIMLILRDKLARYIVERLLAAIHK